MVSKTFYAVVASVLFAQAVYCQQCQCAGNNLGNIGIRNGGGWGENAGWTSSIGGGNSNCGLGSNIIGTGSGIISSGYSNTGGGLILPSNAGCFIISSASPAYEFPGGVVLNSENQIGGQVSVSGATPFLGAAYFGGEVHSSGDSSLVYNAGPSVSLNGGGCGYGFAGAGAGLSGLGASCASSGLGGASLYNSGLSVAAPRSCNCY